MATAVAPLTRDDLREELALFRNEIRQHYATKADLHALETRLTRWMIGLMVTAIGAASGIAIAVDRLAG